MLEGLGGPEGGKGPNKHTLTPTSPISTHTHTHTTTHTHTHTHTRHGCPELCIHVVNNMYGYNAMEVQEAFVKIREQVGCSCVCACVCACVCMGRWSCASCLCIAFERGARTP